MNQNNKNQDNSNSFSMDLESLRQKYSNLLIQYKAAVADYVNYLNRLTTSANSNYDSSAPNYKINNEQYTSLQGMAFNGSGTAGQSDATTLQDCEASCANLSNCTGATFVSERCLVRTGDSPIVPAGNDSYAIIPKSKQLLLNMEDIQPL